MQHASGVSELCLPYLGHQKAQADGSQLPPLQSAGSNAQEREVLQKQLPLLLSTALQKRAASTVALELPYMHLWGKSEAHLCVLQGALHGANQLQSLDLLQVCINTSVPILPALHQHNILCYVLFCDS